MNQSNFIKRQAELLGHLDALAGDYSALMASLILEDTHPLHSRFTSEWQSLSPETQQKYTTKDGRPSCFIFIKRRYYGIFKKDFCEAWESQLLEHLHSLYNLSQPAL